VRKLIAALTVAGLIIAVPGAFAGPSTTQTHIYQAFKSNGQPAIHVVRTVHGHCVGGSSSTDRDDAWRCFSGNLIYDPCFSSAKARGKLLCPAAPWKNSGVELLYTGKLTGGDKGKASTSRLPWGIETTSGLKCAFASGATNVIGHNRLNYFCTTGKNGLWGSPSRKSEPWTIYIAAESAKHLSQRIGIKVAWF
jgi:hypothetical protein